MFKHWLMNFWVIFRNIKLVQDVNFERYTIRKGWLFYRYYNMTDNWAYFKWRKYKDLKRWMCMDEFSEACKVYDKLYMPELFKEIEIERIFYKKSNK